MNGAGCWSTVVCTPKSAPSSVWPTTCSGSCIAGWPSGTPVTTPPTPAITAIDRGLWLGWNDFDTQAQSLIERNPCSARSLTGAHCLFFEAHGGPHFYATGNRHAPTAIAAASVTGRRAVVRPVADLRHRADQYRTGRRWARCGFAGAPSGPLPGDGYRGGRRSTNMEPPVVEGASMDGLERRHRCPEPRAHRPAPQSGPGSSSRRHGRHQTGGQPRRVGLRRMPPAGAAPAG